MRSGMVQRTHCKRGHEFTEENVYVYADGYRRCRVCRGQRKQESERHAAYNRRYIVGWQLKRRRQEIDDRLSSQPITPLGELVRNVIEEIGGRVGALPE